MRVLVCTVALLSALLATGCSSKGGGGSDTSGGSVGTNDSGVPTSVPPYSVKTP